MTGDQNDVLARLKATLPNRWFGDTSPVLDALLTGWADALSFVYSLWAYAKLQTRIKTATDGWLDLIAADFFGAALQRTAGQSDASLRARIIANLFRQRDTRHAVSKVLQDLTGIKPAIFEPLRPLDTGVYGGPNLGYGVAGGYGSMQMPCQALVIAYRPIGTGIPNVAGYGVSTAGYGVGSQAEYASLSMSAAGVQDADIFAAIDSVKAAGTVLWTQIQGDISPFGHLGVDFIVGQSAVD